MDLWPTTGALVGLDSLPGVSVSDSCPAVHFAVPDFIVSEVSSSETYWDLQIPNWFYLYPGILGFLLCPKL